MSKVNYTIYQIENVDESNDDYDYLRSRRYWSLDPSEHTVDMAKDHYKKVFTGEIECKNAVYACDKIYGWHQDYGTPKRTSMRSVSVSDIIQVGDSFSRVESFGFKTVKVINCTN